MFVTANMKTDSLLAHSRNPLESTKGGLACSSQPADEPSVPQQEVPAPKCIKLTKKTRNYVALIFLFSTTFGRLAPVEETSVELKEIRFSDIF